MVTVKPPFMEDMVVSSSTRPPQMMVERRSRSQKDQPLNCPRCNSTNTKFCYYNNYSLTQPRYFCKTCRRYWTEGGSLRNVPVGGGSRKNKRSSSSSSSNPPSSSSNPNQKKLLASDLLIASPPVVLSSTSNNTRFHETTGGHDLNLAFPQTHQLNLSGEYGDCQYQNLSISNTSSNNNIPQTYSSSSSSAATTLGISALPAMDRLSSSGVSSRSMMMNRFIPNAVYPNGGFGLQNFRSAATLNFNVDGSTVGGGIGYHQNNVQEGPGGDRLLFPFEDLRQVSSTNPNDHQTENNPQQQFDQSRGQGGDSSGYWNGVIGSGTLW